MIAAGGFKTIYIAILVVTATVGFLIKRMYKAWDAEVDEDAYASKTSYDRRGFASNNM
jgi:hypothetical protein